MASYQGKRLSQVDHRDVPFNDGVRATMEQGAVVRAGVEKTSAKVGDLPGFAQLVVVERASASCGTERFRITAPLKGWVSSKIISFAPRDAAARPETKEPPREDAPLDAARLRAHERTVGKSDPNVEYAFLKGIDYSPGGDSTTGFFVAPSDDGFVGSDSGLAGADSGDELERPALARISSGNIERPEAVMPRVSSGNLEAPASAFPRFGSGNLEVPLVDETDDVAAEPTPIKSPKPPQPRFDPEHRTIYSIIKCCYSSGSPSKGAAFASP